jgi:hypothetical protein
MTMSPWREQPAEQARLFNPAFLGALVLCAVRGYERESTDGRQGLPYALAFLAVPVVLHKMTRDALPKTVATSLAAWISVNAYAQVGFAERASAMVPMVKDSIATACHGGLIDIQGPRLHGMAKLRSVERFVTSIKSPEVVDCVKRAIFVGRWFAGSGDYRTVMALWGVRP